MFCSKFSLFSIYISGQNHALNTVQYKTHLRAYLVVPLKASPKRFVARQTFLPQPRVPKTFFYPTRSNMVFGAPTPSPLHMGRCGGAGCNTETLRVPQARLVSNARVYERLKPSAYLWSSGVNGRAAFPGGTSMRRFAHGHPPVLKRLARRCIKGTGATLLPHRPWHCLLPLAAFHCVCNLYYAYNHSIACSLCFI
jgi:hypothetical protein